MTRRYQRQPGRHAARQLLRRLVPLALLLGVTGFAAEPDRQKPPASLDEQMQLFLDWFPGEYNNYEQFYLDTEAQVEQVHEHIHHIFYPVDAPEIGAEIFFVQQYLDGDPEKIYRQRLYRFTEDVAENALRLDIFSFTDEAKYRNAHLTPDILNSLTQAELIERPGCEVYWQFDVAAENFHGYMKEKACNFVSEQSGKRIFITDDLRLTPEQIWIRDEAFDEDGARIFGNRAGIHHKNRRVKYYSGWAGVSTEGPTLALEENNWERNGALWAFTGDLNIFGRFILHNEGQIVPVTNEAGEASGYSVQLAKLTYTNTNLPILTLKIIEVASGKTLAYSWAEPDSARVGINTRWAQSGLTLRPGPGRTFGWLTD